MTQAFRFIDLFAGVGGFHAALTAYGGECVYAVEIDKAAAAVYERNWGHDPSATSPRTPTTTVMNVPAHEVLAAGFPCQPFSKSGAQRGMDETRGTLYWNILQIIEERKPKVVLLENVRNLAGPRHLTSGRSSSRPCAIRATGSLRRPRSSRLTCCRPSAVGARRSASVCSSRPPITRPVSATTCRSLPVALPSDRIDGWDPKQQWHLEDLLDDSHNIPGCASRQPSGTGSTLGTSGRDLVRGEEGRRPPGFPIWADAWTDFDKVIADFGFVPDYRDLMERDRVLPQWKAGHLAKNYDLFADPPPWIDRWAEKWGVYTERSRHRGASWSGRLRTRRRCGTR